MSDATVNPVEFTPHSADALADSGKPVEACVREALDRLDRQLAALDAARDAERARKRSFWQRVVVDNVEF